MKTARLQDNAAFVHFVRNDAFEVLITACPTRLELVVTVVNANQEKFSLHEMEALSPEPLPALPFGIYEAHADQKKLNRVVVVLAEQFRLAGLPLLHNPESWQQLRQWRASRRKTEVISDLSNTLAAAFHQKQWAEVQRLAAQLGSDASELDRKRAHYASRQHDID